MVLAAHSIETVEFFQNETATQFGIRDIVRLRYAQAQ